MTSCYTCGQTALASRPRREEVWSEAGWRVAHSFNSSLAGWLVLIPLRHVTALDDLAVDEAEAMGRLLWSASAAIRTVTGCAKTYVMLFAEAEGFEHLHIHVVPRMVDLADDRRGPAIFAYLGDAALSDRARDDVAERLRQAWP